MHQVSEKVSRERHLVKVSGAEPTGVIRIVARHQSATGHGRGEMMDIEDSPV